MNEPIAPETCAEGRNSRVLLSWDSVALKCLTPKQTEAVQLRRLGRSERESARLLGIGRDAFRDRLSRALRRLARAHGTLPSLPPAMRDWANGLLRAQRARLRPHHRRCLELHASGKTLKAIASAMDRTESSVRGILKRLRRR